MTWCRCHGEIVAGRTVSERGAPENCVHGRFASFLMEALVKVSADGCVWRLDGMTGEKEHLVGVQMARCTEILLIGRTQATCACMCHSRRAYECKNTRDSGSDSNAIKNGFPQE